MLSDRIPVQQRHQLWSELCNLADNLLDLTQVWWQIDQELATVHDQRSYSDRVQPELPFPIDTDSGEIDF